MIEGNLIYAFNPKYNFQNNCKFPMENIVDEERLKFLLSVEDVLVDI